MIPGLENTAVAGPFCFPGPLVFVFKSPVELRISSPCAQLRHKGPVEKVEAAVDLRQGGGSGGVTCLLLLPCDTAVSRHCSLGLLQSGK